MRDVERDGTSMANGSAPGNPATPGNERSGGSRRGGLGRGLGALIPTPDDVPTAANSEVAIDAIVPNPYQPRLDVDPAALESLAASIRIHGVIQPLVVTHGRESGHYVLIAGERRWRAARLAGLETVPVVVKDAAPRAMLELALVENVIRADLSPLEEAAAYRQLIDDFGLTQAAVAERVGRSRVSVTNTLRLLALPDKVQRAITVAEISEGHARALLGLPTAAEQIAALEDIVARGLSVRQTEELVRRWISDGTPGARRAPADADSGGGRESALQQAFIDGLQRAIGTRVGFRPERTGGGTVTIHFASDEELNAFYAKVAGEDTW
ncbi:MAG: ParB/RepB/Spo0J family partition protein [Thermomicrobiales bacterium]